MDTNLASSLGGGLGGLASFAGIDIQSGDAKKLMKLLQFCPR